MAANIAHSLSDDGEGEAAAPLLTHYISMMAAGMATPKGACWLIVKACCLECSGTGGTQGVQIRSHKLHHTTTQPATDTGIGLAEGPHQSAELSKQVACTTTYRKTRNNEAESKWKMNRQFDVLPSDHSANSTCQQMQNNMLST